MSEHRPPGRTGVDATHKLCSFSQQRKVIFAINYFVYLRNINVYDLSMLTLTTITFAIETRVGIEIG